MMYFYVPLQVTGYKLRVNLRSEFLKGGMRMENWLRGKTAIVIGERDGVQGPSIAKCLEAAGAKVVYAVTECFV
jgi:glycine/sarcosine/betaine reductase complex component A